MSEIKDMDDWERQYYKLLGDTSDAEPANAPTWDDDRKLLRTYGQIWAVPDREHRDPIRLPFNLSWFPVAVEPETDR